MPNTMRIFGKLCVISCIAMSTTLATAATSKEFMVVTEQREATQVGVDILKAGGNAVDAAVAVGYALAVVNPCCGNIGGGGFMLIHRKDGKNIFINFREKAPAKAYKNMFIGKNGELSETASTTGYLAVGVPGTVLGLDTALQKYGTMTRAQVMAPAIKLAENGYRVTGTDAKQFKKYLADFRAQPNIAKIFLRDSQSYTTGERLIQTDLSRSLRLIATHGPDAFYKGSIAKEIVAASQANGGILSLQDFANYNIEELTPIQCHYHGFTVISSPPPSSGGVALCEMLNILENFPLNHMGYQSPAAVRTIIEAMRYGFKDRNNTLGDPNFVKCPLEKLLSLPYAQQLSQEIKISDRAPDVEAPSHFKELTDTTHYSVVDREGNTVAVTYTLNGFFGARVIAGHTGFFLNDEMDDFAAKPGTANKFGLVMNNANEIAPGKRPLSSMTPTIVLRDDRLSMVLGSPGGPRIISAVLLTLINVLDFGMTLQQAVDAPRFHYQGLPDSISTEPFALPFFTRVMLEQKGYHLLPEGYWAAVEAILIDPVTGELHGANDRRRPDGSAQGSSSIN